MANVTSGLGGGGRGDRPRRPGSLPTDWRVEQDLGGAGSLFSNSGPGAFAERAVRVLDVDGGALVLGSTQRVDDAAAFDERAAVAGVEVVRRRSGGGAVLLRPEETVWVDVVVPAGDPLWSDDVAGAFHWLGDVWRAAVRPFAASAQELTVHRGPMVRTRWSSAVCFAGVGAGEVVTSSGAKVVGMAARRTRQHALFQCAVPLVWDSPAYVSLLGLPDTAVDDLAAAAHPLTGVTPAEVVESFLTHLP